MSPSNQNPEHPEIPEQSQHPDRLYYSEAEQFSFAATFSAVAGIGETGHSGVQFPPFERELAPSPNRYDVSLAGYNTLSIDTVSYIMHEAGLGSDARLKVSLSDDASENDPVTMRVLIDMHAPATMIAEADYAEIVEHLYGDDDSRFATNKEILAYAAGHDFAIHACSLGEMESLRQITLDQRRRFTEE